MSYLRCLDLVKEMYFCNGNKESLIVGSTDQMKTKSLDFFEFFYMFLFYNANNYKTYFLNFSINFLKPHIFLIWIYILIFFWSGVISSYFFWSGVISPYFFGLELYPHIFLVWSYNLRFFCSGVISPYFFRMGL